MAHETIDLRACTTRTLVLGARVKISAVTSDSLAIATRGLGSRLASTQVLASDATTLFCRKN
jgi:hypothetical protein